MSTVFLAGASRGVGLEIATRLAQRHIPTIAFLRQPQPELEALGLQVRWGDAMNPDDVAMTTDGLPYLMPKIQVEGYQEKEASENSYRLGEDSISLWLDSARSQLRFLTIEGTDGSKDTTVFISLLPAIKDLQEDNNYGTTLTAEQLTLPIHTPQWNGKFVIVEINGLKRDNQMHVETVKGYLLLGRAK